MQPTVDETRNGEAAGHATAGELEAAREWIGESPSDDGTLALIVTRPAEGERSVLASGRLDGRHGLLGDGWWRRGPRPEPERQLTLMNHRVATLVARCAERVPLAGDQLYVDLDLSHDNLPAGTRLLIGSAVLEITEPPHLGCAKFTSRFGSEAMRFVNSSEGRKRRWRGANARVVVPGTVSVGDRVRKEQGERSAAPRAEAD
jgi:MOSC domain-containing protein YiiM